MKLTLKARDWHNWLSVILVVPMLIVGLTSVLLAHKKALGLDDIELGGAAHWLPGYGEAAAKRAQAEVRANVITSDGQRWVGTKTGLFRVTEGRAEPVAELAGHDVRSLLATPWGVMAATKSGIWIEHEGGWRRTYKGDTWNVSLGADGSVTAATNKGLLVSRDGSQWQPDAQFAEALASLPSHEAPRERVTLNKLMVDLHTGKAFFGKDAEWIWIDLMGAVLVFLCFTGLYLWWRTQTKRRDAARGRLSAVSKAPHG